MTRVCIRKPSRPSGLLPSAKSQTRFACFREARSKRRGFSSRRVLRYVNTKVAKQAFGGSFCEAKDPERSEWARRAPLCERVQVKKNRLLVELLASPIQRLRN